MLYGSVEPNYFRLFNLLVALFCPLFGAKESSASFALDESEDIEESASIKEDMSPLGIKFWFWTTAGLGALRISTKP